jgi:hypothetical protein
MRRLNRVLNVLEFLAVTLLPGWMYPGLPGRPSEERRLQFVTWAIVATVVGALMLGAWLTGLIPPDAAKP